MNTVANNQQQGAVTYLMVTEAQLRQIAEDSAKSVLEQFGNVFFAFGEYQVYAE